MQVEIDIQKNSVACLKSYTGQFWAGVRIRSTGSGVLELASISSQEPIIDIFDQLYLVTSSWHLEMSYDGSIYTIEIDKWYKSEFPPLESWLLNIYQDTTRSMWLQSPYSFHCSMVFHMINNTMVLKELGFYRLAHSNCVYHYKTRLCFRVG